MQKVLGSARKTGNVGVSQVISLPHPNKNSLYYDKLFNNGPLDPVTKTNMINNRVEKLTYQQWIRKISPESVAKLSKQNLS